MTLGILGGTFNPPHLGHVILAQEILNEFNLSKLLLVPCFIPPHKKLEADPGAEERLAMTELLKQYDARIDVLDWEIKAQDISYTITTLERLYESQEYKDYCSIQPPYLIIGDDLAAKFYTWRNPQKILELARIIVARRSTLVVSIDFPHEKAHNALIEISSTMVRKRIQEGKGWEWLCPESVSKYIKDKKLYGANK